MFKSAATKIAHNSTIPSLAIAGNKDLRPLQDLITAEKSIVQSLVKLSTDFTKASEALKHWAVGEGDDLGVSLYPMSSGLIRGRRDGALGSRKGHINADIHQCRY